MTESQSAILGHVLKLPAYRMVLCPPKVCCSGILFTDMIFSKAWISECNSILARRHWNLGGAFNWVGKQTRKERVIMPWISTKTGKPLGQQEHPHVPGVRDNIWQVSVTKMIPERKFEPTNSGLRPRLLKGHLNFDFPDWRVMRWQNSAGKKETVSLKNPHLD